MSKKPVAVLISDVHYNLQTLELADKAMRLAIQKATRLSVPLVIAGDLHDTKANLRGECLNTINETLEPNHASEIYLLRGNHDSLNEKSKEHALKSLEYNYDTLDIRHVISELEVICLDRHSNEHSVYMIPYYSDAEELRGELKTIPKGSTVLMHQGLTSAWMGDYIQDKSAITPADVAGLRVISGHYHQRQTIDLPDGGKWDYIGNPYSLSWGEANDPEKGFQILYSDGSLEFVPTNLRKHVIYEADCSSGSLLWDCGKQHTLYSEDLVWIKLIGPKEEAVKHTKDSLRHAAGITNSIKYTIQITDVSSQTSETKNQTQAEILDSTIQSLTQVSEDCKVRLKELWKGLV